ncbi:unnamed protein product [Linum trigynum]|uniref:Uncharacterized protein n=1 Tax=Linum trigynum TaxID=586398 RepID=A0AAV2CHB6_9ROSI
MPVFVFAATKNAVTDSDAEGPNPPLSIVAKSCLVLYSALWPTTVLENIKDLDSTQPIFSSSSAQAGSEHIVSLSVDINGSALFCFCFSA